MWSYMQGTLNNKSACKQCLKIARKNNQEFFCWEDNSVIPTENIQHLTKDLEAYKIMKDDYKMKAKSQRDQFFNNTMSSAWSAGNYNTKDVPASPVHVANSVVSQKSEHSGEKQQVQSQNPSDIRHMISTIQEVEGEESKNESQILGGNDNNRRKKAQKECESSENEVHFAHRSHPMHDIQQQQQTAGQHIVEADEEEDAKESQVNDQNDNSFKLPQKQPEDQTMEQSSAAPASQFQPAMSPSKSDISREENKRIAQELAHEYISQQISQHIEKPKLKDYLELEQNEIKELSQEEEEHTPAIPEKISFGNQQSSNTVVPEEDDEQQLPGTIEERKVSHLSLESSESPYEKKVTEYKNLDKKADEGGATEELHSVILRIPDTQPMNINEEATPSQSYEIISRNAPISNEEGLKQNEREQIKPVIVNQESSMSVMHEGQPQLAGEVINDIQAVTDRTQLVERKQSPQKEQSADFASPFNCPPDDENCDQNQKQTVQQENNQAPEQIDEAKQSVDKQQVLAYGLTRTTTQLNKEEKSLSETIINKKKKKGKKQKKQTINKTVADKPIQFIEQKTQSSKVQEQLPEISEVQQESATTPLVANGNDYTDYLNTSKSLENQEIEDKHQIYVGKTTSFGAHSTQQPLSMRKMVTKKSNLQLESDIEEQKNEAKEETDEEKIDAEEYDQEDYFEAEADIEQAESPQPKWAQEPEMSTQNAYSSKKLMTMQLNQQFQQPEIQPRQFGKSMPPLPSKDDQTKFKLPEINNSRAIHQKPVHRPPAPIMQQRRMISSPLSVGRQSSEEIKKDLESRESAGSRYINSKRNSPMSTNQFVFQNFNADSTDQRPPSTRSNQSVQQDSRRAQSLTEQCRLHPHESIKYFCRDEKCMKALCPDCVIEHARHNFIAANELAALEVKGAVKNAIRKCRQYAKNIKNIKLDTHKKLSDLHRQRQDEFQKIHCYFLELHRELDEREQQLKQLYNDNIKDIESRLMQDSQAIELEYTKQSTTFKKFKSLQDQFQLSTDSGIVGAAEMVYHQTNKLETLDEIANLPYYVVTNQGKELPNPNVVLVLDKEKEKIQNIGKVISQIGEYDIDATGEADSNQILSQQVLTEETKQVDDLTKSKTNLILPISPKRTMSQGIQVNCPLPILKQSQSGIEHQQIAKTSDPHNVHWFKWGTSQIFKFEPIKNHWLERKDVKVDSKFLFFSSVCHLPINKGCFLMGGSDNEDNYSKRTQYFCKYNVFVEKPHMISKRAFFPSIYCKLDNSIFVVGGNDSSHDLDKCEKFSLSENTWRQTASLNTSRNGSALVIFEQYRLMFCFGGNNHKLGSLNKIERYDMDFDKWTTISMTLKTAVHDLGLIQLENERVLVYGGHTNQEPSKQIHLMDMTIECLKAKSSLLKLKKGGKCYFNPIATDTNKVMLMFGYLDDKPEVEEIDLQEIGPISESSMILSSKQVESQIETHRSNK